jgi:hypothetical protein
MNFYTPYIYITIGLTQSKKSKTDPKLSTDRFELEGPDQEQV